MYLVIFRSIDIHKKQPENWKYLQINGQRKASSCSFYTVFVYVVFRKISEEIIIINVKVGWKVLPPAE